MIGDRPEFDIFAGGKRIYSRSEAEPPQLIGDDAEVTDCIISQGCRIHGRVERSVLSPGVIVEKGAVVRDSVLMRGAVVERGASVEHAILDELVTVSAESRVGTPLGEGELSVVGREGEA